MVKRAKKVVRVKPTNKGPGVKFRLLRTLLRGAIKDGVPVSTIAKRAGVSTKTIYNWIRQDSTQQSCSLDKAHQVIKAIDREMGLGD